MSSEGGPSRSVTERASAAPAPTERCSHAGESGLLTGGRSQADDDRRSDDGRGRTPAVEVNTVIADCLIDIGLEPDALIWYQKHDTYCRALAFRISRGKWPRYCPPTLKRENVDRFRFVNGILCRSAHGGDKLQVVWPVAKRFEALHRHHDSPLGSHCGEAKLYEALSRHIWYLGLQRDCRNYVASCVRCSAKKDDRGPPPPPILPQEPAGPGDELVIDVVHMPASRTSGRTLVLTCIDKFTGFLTFYPLQSGSADDIVQALSSQFFVFGPPRRLECDAGSNVRSQSVQRLCRFWGVELRSAVGGHHEAIGKVERRHRDIKRRLRALSDNFGVDWESHLPGVVFSLNHEMSDSHGYSPYFLFFLRHVNSPMDRLVSQPTSPYSSSFVEEKLRLLSGTLKQARANLLSSQRQQKIRHDLKHGAKEPTIQPGDQIRIRNQNYRPGVSRKMVEPWSPIFVMVRWVSRRHLEYMDPVTGRIWATH